MSESIGEFKELVYKRYEYLKFLINMFMGHIKYDIYEDIRNSCNESVIKPKRIYLFLTFFMSKELNQSLKEIKKIKKDKESYQNWLDNIDNYIRVVEGYMAIYRKFKSDSDKLIKFDSFYARRGFVKDYDQFVQNYPYKDAYSNSRFKLMWPEQGRL